MSKRGIYHEISRLVLPDFSFLQNINLFLKEEMRTFGNEDKLAKYKIYKTDTWMNIFPAKKYFFYTDIDDLYLHINIDKDSKIQICSFSYSKVVNNDEILITKDVKANKDYYIKIEDISVCDNLYLNIITEDKNKELKIRNCSWVTTKEPSHENKLAIVICTYKREEYVRRNIILFKDFIKKNKDLSGKIKLFIIDNGNTLSNEEVETKDVALYHNKNTGGAGGFTRGIIEAMRKEDEFGRILLMDDDVRVFPESFYRTLVLSNYLKPEYKDAFIHGAMLDLYDKNMFIESAAIKTKTWVSSYHEKMDISDKINVAKANYIPTCIFNNERVSSAWWYCCFSTDIVKKNGLPLPVFFRCDDIEWSWRNSGQHHISMNGICVWHSPFEWRVSKPVDYYFSKRNIAMVNMIYTPNYKKRLSKMFRRDFLRLLELYDYTSAEIYLRMLKDLQKGALIYKQDPEKILKEVCEYAKQDIIKPIDSFIGMKEMLQNYAENIESPKKYKRKFYLNKLLFLITLGGHLVPKFLWGTGKNVPLDHITKEEFFFQKSVNVLNLLNNTFEVRKIDERRAKVLKREFDKNLKCILKNYEKLQKDFILMREEYSKPNFWKQYLNID